MAEDLLNALEDLTKEQLEKFKWFLQQPDVVPGLPTIKKKDLEEATSLKIVDLLVQTYTLEPSMEVTQKILEKINRKDLMQKFLPTKKSANTLAFQMCPQHDKPLELFCKTDQTCVCSLCVQEHKNHELVPLREESKGKKAELRSLEAGVQEMIQDRQQKIQEFRKSLKISRDAADREKAEGVQVFTALKEAAERGLKELIKEIEDKQETAERRAEGFIRDLEEEISELRKRSSEVEQLSQSEDHLHLLQSFCSLKDAPPTKTWTEVRVHPPSYEGIVERAVAPLVKEIRENMKKMMEAEMKRVQQYAVDVTLDPKPVNIWAALSDDRKQAKPGDAWKPIPLEMERNSMWGYVSGQQRFSSGRFYFEVQVKGKTQWDLGVARESVNRKTEISLCPQNGFWMVGLTKGNEYSAHADPPVRLHVLSAPQKVGVFVDYEQGLVSFFDADAAALIYSFTGCRFNQKLRPYFSPGSSDGGKNFAPLVINPVNQPDGNVGQVNACNLC